MEQVVVLGHSFVREMMATDFSLNLRYARVLYGGHLKNEKTEFNLTVGSWEKILVTRDGRDPGNVFDSRVK